MEEKLAKSIDVSIGWILFLRLFNRYLGLPTEKAMAPHSSTLAWKIPWMEEPGGLQSMGSLESDMTERLPFHFSLSCIGEGNGNPLQCSCLENPRDGGAWWLPFMGSHRVGHDWSDLAAAAAAANISYHHHHFYSRCFCHYFLVLEVDLLTWLSSALLCDFTSSLSLRSARRHSDGNWQFMIITLVPIQSC